MSVTPYDAGGAAQDLSATQRRAWLALILAVACGLRVFRIGWGLPDFIFNDTRIHFVEAAAHAVALGDWTLDRFVHPPLYPYVVSVLTWTWATLAGETISLQGPDAKADVAAIVLIARLFTIVLALLLIVVTYLLGRRLLGTRAGLWAAAFLALSPMQILESHRVNVDTPMILLSVLAAHQAVTAHQERSRGRLLVSFALAALAGAVKYTGLHAGTLPLFVALRWPDADWRRRLRLVASGGAVAAAVFLGAISPVFLAWDVFVRNVIDVFFFGIFHGAPGQDLVGESWVYRPYLYLLFVGFPFVMGWAVYAAALAGLVVMAVRWRPALTLFAAGSLPFFLLQGSVETATARYYLPFAPYLAIAAAAFLLWLRDVGPRLAAVAAVLIVGYSLVLATSQVARVGGAPQAATGALLDQLATGKSSTGVSLRAIREPRLIIAYPSWAISVYDAVLPYIRSRRDRKLLFLPSYLRSPGDAVEPAEAMRQDRAWTNSGGGIDVVVVPSVWENYRPRHSMRPREEQFYDALIEGRLGFREVSHEETTYFTQAWYEWADPTLDTVWTAGIGGYRLFVRDDLVPVLSLPTM